MKGKNKTLDLEPKYLSLIQFILQQYVPECEVRAFGSRVRGKAEKYSDLDLVLVGTSQLAPRRIEELKDAFSASNLPISVDIIDWHAISDNFRKEIAKNFLVVKTH